jgi:carboxyl-terminal processing protease
MNAVTLTPAASMSSRLVGWTTAWLVMLSLVMPGSAAPPAFTTNTFDRSSEFGPSPDEFFPAPASRHRFDDQDPAGGSSNFGRGRTGWGSRDPSWSRSDSRPRRPELRLEGPSRLRDQLDDYDNYPVRRPVLDDMPPWNDNLHRLPNLNDEPAEEFVPRVPRTPVREPAPTPATTKPARAPLAERISKRYADPRVIRIVQQLNAQTGEALYVEVSQLIDARHVTPTSYQQRVQSGLQQLSLAVSMPEFQQALRVQPSPQAVAQMQRQFQQLAAQGGVQDLNGAMMVMRQAGQVLSQGMNVNTGVASLEFVYGALETLDQYSMFVAPEKSGSTSLGLKEQQVGIGVEIEAHPRGLMILKALAGGPAAAATLRRGDIITSVDGKSIAGMELSAAADMIGGPSGSPVTLGLRRDNMIADLTLVRRPFQVQSVSEVRMEANNTGYIKLDQFAESSTREMDAALMKLHNEGMESLILDLRGNPGGLLTTAIELSDRFLPTGTIVSTRGRTGADNSTETAKKANTWKVPLVVLIDKNSASASEIFAAAIQENGRGMIVGQTSYGKGTVQTLFPLRSVASALRLTTAKFYSPEGREMAGVGVTPDVRVNVNAAVGGNDTALQAALRATQDPRLMDMANMLNRVGQQPLRVIRVAA